MRFGPEKQFSVKGCYYALNFGGVTCSGNSEIWNSWAPKNCKVFAWLALHNRLSTRDRLTRRGIIDDATCPFGCQTEEILTHLLFQCPHTSSMWRNFQIQNTQAIQNVQGAITNPRHMPPQPRKEWATLFIAIAWNIWLTRNRKVFDNVSIPEVRMVENCWESILLWSNRCKQLDRRRNSRDWVTANRVA
jgi:hypothetical protein